MNYFANFNANNGTRLMTDLQGTNKNKLMNAIRKQAISECFEGSQAIWWVCDRKGHYMFSGMVYKENGKTYFTRDQH